MLDRSGIDLACNAYDVIAEAETEHPDFAGFCTNGCGDVYGMRNGAVVLFGHETRASTISEHVLVVRFEQSFLGFCRGA